MLRESDVSYFAGLFDGEGCIQCKQYVETKKKHKGPGTRKTKVWRVTMEIAMTDGDVINWIKDTFQVGTVKEIDKTRAPTGKPYYKKQYRWRCSHRDAYHICMLIWPHVKKCLPLARLTGIARIPKLKPTF